MVNIGLEGSFPKSTLIWVAVLNALLVAIVFPTVEELYFRGFLLPRMPASLKGWTPLAHTLLFAAHHTWSPWLFVALAVGVLPMV